MCIRHGSSSSPTRTTCGNARMALLRIRRVLTAGKPPRHGVFVCAASGLMSCATHSSMVSCAKLCNGWARHCRVDLIRECRHATCNPQYAKHKMRYTLWCNTWHATRDTPCIRCNGQRAACKVQRAPIGSTCSCGFHPRTPSHTRTSTWTITSSCSSLAGELSPACCILHVVRCALCVASCTLHVVRCILHAVCFACCQLACLPAVCCMFL